MGVLERLRAAVSAFRCATPPSADDELLDLRRDVAAARLELQETQAALERERARVRSLEAGRAEAVREGTEARVEQLLQALAAPLSQLRTQGYLLREDKPVQVTDVLAVAEQIAAAALQAGLEAVGVPGEATSFDPETMQPLRGDEACNPGERVVVKFAGFRYGSKIMRKALVQRSG